MFCFVYYETIQTENRRPNNMQETSLQSYTKLKSKLSLNLGYLNRALNNPAQELGFKA